MVTHILLKTFEELDMYIYLYQSKNIKLRNRLNLQTSYFEIKYLTKKEEEKVKVFGVRLLK